MFIVKLELEVVQIVKLEYVLIMVMPQQMQIVILSLKDVLPKERDVSHQLHHVVTLLVTKHLVGH